MSGLPVDVKRTPASQREHAFLRLGCLGAAFAVAVIALLVEYRWSRGGASAVVLSTMMYLLWGAVGLDLGILFESHEKYLERYRAKQEEAHEQGAALFDKSNRQPSDRE